MANCKTCLHAAVCGKRIATGGHVKECKNSVEKKTGRWLEIEEGTICSECHEHPFADGECAIADYNGNYCPNCGADMRRDGNGI